VLREGCKFFCVRKTYKIALFLGTKKKGKGSCGVLLGWRRGGFLEKKGGRGWGPSTFFSQQKGENGAGLGRVCD